MFHTRISNDDNNNKRKATDTPTALNKWIKKVNTQNNDVKQDIFQKYRQAREAASNKAIANSVYTQIKPYQPTSATFGQQNLTKPFQKQFSPPSIATVTVQQLPQIVNSKLQPNNKPTVNKPPITYNVNNNNINPLKLPAIVNNSKKFIVPDPEPEPVTVGVYDKKQKTKETPKQQQKIEEEPEDVYLSVDDDEDEDPQEFNGSKVVGSVRLDEIEAEEKFYGDDDDEVPDDEEIEVIPTTTEEEDEAIMNEAEMRRNKFRSTNYDKKKVDRYDPYKELSVADNLKLNEEDKPFAKAIKQRREDELKRYTNDNYYDFSEFTAFSNPDEEEECLDWDNSRDLVYYVTGCAWKYTEKHGTVLEYKGNLDGMTTSPSCTIITTGFKSNFYIQPPAHWKDEDMKKFVNVLNHVVKNLYKWRNGKDRRIVDKIAQLFVKYEAVTAEAINGYTKDDGREMYKIYCLYPKAVAAARKVLNKPWKFDWAYSRETIRVFDADVDFTQRYFYDTATEPCRWFRIPAHHYEVVPTWSRGRASRSKVEVVCKNEFMTMIPKDNEEYKNKVPSFSVMSYDTEQCNKPFKFPAPRVFPMIVKTMNISRYPNFSKSKNVLMVYAYNGELPPELEPLKDDPTAASQVLPGVDYFYWFKSEPGLMEHFRRFVIHADIDTIVDYNGGSYDWQRIYENGSMYFGEPYRIFGRDLYKKSWIDRNEWRSRTDYSVNIDGRWCIDMVKRTRAEAPFWPNPPPDFSLNSVCLNYLGETKEEFDVNLMESKWMNKNTVIQIWRYGKKDAELPAKLCDKMNTISTFISMAQMTNLTFQKALDGGTGRKIEGFLRKLGMDRPVPLLFECLAKKTGINHNLTNSCARDVEGAQVIEPKKGYYEQYIAIFDFSSMYPSIMRLLNTCLRTYLQQGMREHLGLNPDDFWCLPRYDYDPATNKIYMLEDYNGHTFVKSKVKLGLMPEAQEKLGQWRAKVRAEMDVIKKQIIPGMEKELARVKADTTLSVREKEEQIAKLEEDIRVQRFSVVNMEGFQNAIKILMNGMFGQTIFSAGKLYCKAIGETVLTFGRYMINYVRSFINTTFCIANGAEVDLDVIYGDSVTGDTPIMCKKPDGSLCYMTIETMGNGNWESRGNTDKEICEPCIEGLQVWTERGFTPIKRVIRHKTGKKIFRVLTHTGCVDVTEDHSLLTPDAIKIKPSEVKVGDPLLHVDLPVNNGNNNNNNITITEKIAKSWGLFFADGSCGTYNEGTPQVKSSWAINKLNYGLLESVIGGLEEDAKMRSLDMKFKILDTVKSSGVYKLVATGEVKSFVSQWRNLFYDNRKYKKIPDEILNAPENIRRAFWEGYYSGDGDKDKHGYLRCDVKGKIGASGLYWLASSLGYPVSINTRKDKPDIYRITLTRGEKKRQRKDPNAIKKIEEMPKIQEDFVYDLETENHHFSAGVGRMIVHNTDSVMVALMQSMFGNNYKDVLKLFKAVKIAINGNFSGPVEMNLENITHGFLLQGKKNYAAGKLKNMESDYQGKPEERSLIMKGFRFKKKGTSPLAARAGKFITDTAVLKRDKDTAFQYVRDILVALKRRQVTRSDLIVRANFGRDITAALYNYMVQCRQQGNPPPKATEEVISKRFFALSESDREGSSSATPSVVYAYRAMCKDPAQWFERGNTIYFIYAEGNSGTKGNLVCSVADAINMDIPYNVDVYIQEVLKITKKVLAKMVGDMDNEKTPNFDSLTINHPSVKLISNGQHISFFDSRFGAKDYSIMKKAKLAEEVKDMIGTKNPRLSVELNKDEEGNYDGTAIVSEKILGIMSDVEMCNNAVIRLIDNSANSGENTFTVERINRYYTYTYNKCSMCKSDISSKQQFGNNPQEQSLTLCDNCLSAYGTAKFNCDMKMHEMKKKVNDAWDKCAKCLQADPTQALDCVSYSCDHYTKRMDVTLQYYQEYVKVKGIRDIEDLISSQQHEVSDGGEVVVHKLSIDKEKVEKMKAARERREQRKKKKLEELSQSQSNDSI